VTREVWIEAVGASIPGKRWRTNHNITVFNAFTRRVSSRAEFITRGLWFSITCAHASKYSNSHRIPRRIPLICWKAS
jgi:hypothetical protein